MVNTFDGRCAHLRSPTRDPRCRRDLGAVFVAIVTAFVNFPIALIILVILRRFVYQQIENLPDPAQIQKRATKIEAFICSGRPSLRQHGCSASSVRSSPSLPAASIQIAVHEYREYRARWRHPRRGRRPHPGLPEATDRLQLAPTGAAHSRGVLGRIIVRDVSDGALEDVRSARWILLGSEASLGRLAIDG